MGEFSMKEYIKKVFKLPEYKKPDTTTCLAIILLVAFIFWVFYTVKLFLWEYISPFVMNETTISFLNHLKNSVIEHKLICIIFIILFFAFVRYLKIKIKVQDKLDELAKVKQKMEDLINPEQFHNCLKEEIITIKCATNLLPLFDPAEKNGAILSLITALRLHIAIKFGFVFPNARVMDDSSLPDDEYWIFIQGDCVFKGNIKDTKKLNFNIQCSSKICDDKHIGNALKVIDNLGDCIITNINDIISRLDITKIISYSKSKYKSEIYDLVLTKFADNDLREIFANLIREKVSIIDYPFIFYKIYKYSEFYKTPDEISERLRIDLLKQATIKVRYENAKVYTIELDEKLENLLKDNIQIRENSKFIHLDKINLSKFKDKILTVLNEYAEKEPIIICSKEIRLPLFRLISKYVPHITVYAKEELAKNIKLENIRIIELSE